MRYSIEPRGSPNDEKEELLLRKDPYLQKKDNKLLMKRS